MPVNRSAWRAFFLIGIIGVESARLTAQDHLDNGVSSRGPCTGFRFDSSKGTITTGFKVGDYVLGKCLGKGVVGMAFDATGNLSSAEVIVKVQGVSQHDYDGSGPPYKGLDGAQAECLIAHEIKKRAPSQTVDCLYSEASEEPPSDEWGVWLDGTQVFISISEKAPGKELGSICSPSQDITPAELPTLKSVFQKVVEIFDYMDALDGGGNSKPGHLRIFHHDLHVENIFLSSSGQMTFIDYGQANSCCEVPGTCAEFKGIGTRECYDTKREQSVNTNWLVKNMLAMLIPFKIKRGAYDLPYPLNPTTIFEAMRDSYKESWIPDKMDTILETAIKGRRERQWPPRFIKLVQELLVEL